MTSHYTYCSSIVKEVGISSKVLSTHHLVKGAKNTHGGNWKVCPEFFL